jgi:hypothetical protein
MLPFIRRSQVELAVPESGNQTLNALPLRFGFDHFGRRCRRSLHPSSEATANFEMSICGIRYSAQSWASSWRPGWMVVAEMCAAVICHSFNTLISKIASCTYPNIHSIYSSAIIDLNSQRLVFAYCLLTVAQKCIFLLKLPA